MRMVTFMGQVLLADLRILIQVMKLQIYLIMVHFHYLVMHLLQNMIQTEIIYGQQILGPLFMMNLILWILMIRIIL